eukprot:scaffold2748_cov115-Pinguiococcus_pyrenoidosus.AAC.1
MLPFGAKPKPHTARQILDKLRGIAKMSGNKSQDRKVGEIQRMLASSQGSEAKYIVRALQGRLRIGCSERTVIRAVAYAVAQSQDLLPEEATPVEGAPPLITEAIQLRDAKKLTVDER